MENIPSERAKKIMETEAPSPNLANKLMNEGFTAKQTNDAINQASMGQNIPYSEEQMTPSMMDQEPPAPTQAPSIPQAPKGQMQLDYNPTSLDQIEELVESVVEEKWRTLMENFGDINLWKERTRTDLTSVKQELIRLEGRFENLQKAVLGKIQDYDKNMIEVGSNMKALEKVFKKILDPLTTNIKELSKITKELKK